jgi:Insertion element 4 transposase N-terminal/Transposase DDE domain
MPFIVPHDPPASLPIATMVERVIPAAVLDTLAARYRPPDARNRKLPGPLVLLLVIAMFLYPATELSTVLALLLLPRRLQRQVHSPAGKGAISRARYRWGPRPLAALMRQVCQPLATSDTPGAFLFGRRTVAFDGSYEELAATPENERVFGRARSQYGPAAFPQLMGLYLVECGTHAILDACPWPRRISEHRAVRRLLRSITAEMLVLWDCGLHSYPLATAIREREAHFLARVPAYQTFEPLRALPDGSVVARWYKDPPSRRPKRQQSEAMVVRVISYHLDGKPALIRLVTSLLDPAATPALELIGGYHERWEAEGTFSELGHPLRLVSSPLRSRKPQGVVQEFYGLILAHYLVRALMADAAQSAHLDPDRISFVRAARLLPAGLLLGDLLGAAEREALLIELCSLLIRAQLPPRRHRTAPRTRKRPRSRYRFRTRTDRYQTTTVPPSAPASPSIPHPSPLKATALAKRAAPTHPVPL